ncbi:hypothetical protein B0H11DRAFT_2078002 [Mycena galericulata]|nr:hypothetical protein B0H11DRAFT_2078002 [Mycena galericulata]
MARIEVGDYHSCIHHATNPIPIQQTSANAQGLAQLAERIQLLTPIIVSETASPPSKSRIVEALERELQSITKDLEAFGSRGKLQQFFNSSENAACLARHNMSLMQIVSTATLANVHDVREILKNAEVNFNSSQPMKRRPEVGMRDITGGFGGTGAYARFGGEGGEGEGPRLDIEHGENLKFGKISGGTGGAGGAGVEVGGKGGTGKGPVIVFRRNTILVADPKRAQGQQMDFPLL